MGRNARFARTASEEDLAQADAAFMFAEEEENLPATTTTTATTTTAAATASTSSSSTRRTRQAALTIRLPGSGPCTAATTTITTTTTTTDSTTGVASAAAVPSGPARRAPRATPTHLPPELPATAREVTDVASLARVVTLLSAVIEKAVHDGKSVTAVNKRLISCAAEEIRRAAHALARASPAEQPTQTTPTTTTTTTTDATGLDGVKKELVACVRAEITKLKAELVAGARHGRPPSDAAAASTSRSYAQALGSGSARRPAAAAHQAVPPSALRVTRPAIIVSTKAQVTTTQQAVEAFRRSISFRASNYAPARLKKVSHNKLRVEFDTDLQRDDALQRLDNASEVTAEPARTSKPMLILKGINKCTPSSELVDIVRGQNNCTGGELALKFLRKNRNENLYSAVLVASPDVWRKLVDQGRVCVDHQRVHVERFSPFIQCFACLQFGHVRKNCEPSAPKPCACCASTAHQEPDCPSKGDKCNIKCYNCVHRNAKFNNSDPINHKATSSSCSVLRAMRARVEERVDYGTC